MSNLDQLKKLREETEVSISECRKALEEAKWDLEKAKEILKKWGKKLARTKSQRETAQGIIEGYLHPNKKVGALLELDCETDFVARSKDFQELAHEICLQVAAIGDEETPLLEQPWIKDATKTVKDLIDEYIAKLGENIVVKRFVKYKI